MLLTGMMELKHTLPVGGVMSFDESRVAAIGAPAGLDEFLLKNGLPIFDSDDPPFGVVFEEPGRFELKKKVYIVAAREIWEDDLLIGV